MKICFETELAGFQIRLSQYRSAPGRFTVIYGQEVREGLTYEQAGAKLGLAIMHAAACEGKLDANLD